MILECITTICQQIATHFNFFIPCWIESSFYQIRTSYSSGSQWHTFLLFTFQPKNINFFTATSTFMLLFHLLLMHNQDWLNTARYMLLLQMEQMPIVSCSDWLCTMKVMVMTFSIMLFCIQFQCHPVVSHKLLSSHCNKPSMLYLFLNILTSAL